MSERLTIELPWPSKSLSPNARVHWRRVVEIKKIAKRDAFYATRSARKDPIEADSLSARVQFFPPDRRARDTDNIIKPTSDALVKAGIVEDDSLCEWVSARWSDDLQGHAVVITVEVAA